MFGSSLDRAAKSAGPEVIELIEGIAEWTLSLQGRTPLLKGLAHLRDAFGAEAVVLTRLGRSPGTGSQLLCADRRSGEPSVEPIARSYAAELLGPYLFKPRAGSVWFADPADIDGNPARRRLRRERGISDLAIIVLEVEEKALFFLEVHMQHRLKSDSRAAMNGLGGTLMSIWSQRATGRFSEALLRGKPASVAEEARKGTLVDILSVGNPAQLSRAEFRVCTLLSTGLTAARIPGELGISESTLRTHLRQIYAKTGSANMAELLFNLLACDLPASHAIAPKAIRSAS